MKQTKLNHYVPQFATRPWLLGGDHFIQLSLGNGTVESARAAPKIFGGEHRLYSQVIEDSFADIEGRMAPLQRKLARGEQLSVDERHGWAMWLLASYLRTPQAILRSAEVNQVVGPFRGDLFHSWLEADARLPVRLVSQGENRSDLTARVRLAACFRVCFL